MTEHARADAGHRPWLSRLVLSAASTVVLLGAAITMPFVFIDHDICESSCRDGPPRLVELLFRVGVPAAMVGLVVVAWRWRGAGLPRRLAVLAPALGLMIAAWWTAGARYGEI